MQAFDVCMPRIVAHSVFHEGSILTYNIFFRQKIKDKFTSSRRAQLLTPTMTGITTTLQGIPLLPCASPEHPLWSLRVGGACVRGNSWIWHNFCMSRSYCGITRIQWSRGEGVGNGHWLDKMSFNFMCTWNSTTVKTKKYLFLRSMNLPNKELELITKIGQKGRIIGLRKTVCLV